MKTYPILIVLIIAAMGAGCDVKPEQPKVEHQPSALYTEPRQALDKAQGVQQALDQQAQGQRKKLDETLP